MAPWTRASELHRAVHCPASCVLPRPAERESSAADFGTAVHAWVAGGPPSPEVEAWLKGQAGVVRQEGLPDVLLALDTEGGPDIMVVGDPETRNWIRASLPASYVAGECDWVMWPEPWVKDLKTGWHPGRPSRMEQMAFYVLAVIRKAGTEDGYGSIVHWPADGHQPPLEVTDHMDRAPLEEWWANRVIPASRLARGPNPPAIEGEWCRFCSCTGCEFNYDSNQGAM